MLKAARQQQRMKWNPVFHRKSGCNSSELSQTRKQQSQKKGWSTLTSAQHRMQVRHFLARWRPMQCSCADQDWLWEQVSIFINVPVSFVCVWFFMSKFTNMSKKKKKKNNFIVHRTTKSRNHNQTQRQWKYQSIIARTNFSLVSSQTSPHPHTWTRNLSSRVTLWIASTPRGLYHHAVYWGTWCTAKNRSNLYRLVTRIDEPQPLLIVVLRTPTINAAVLNLDFFRTKAGSSFHIKPKQFSVGSFQILHAAEENEQQGRLPCYFLLVNQIVLMLMLLKKDAADWETWRPPCGCWFCSITGGGLEGPTADTGNWNTPQKRSLTDCFCFAESHNLISFQN